MLLLVVGSHGRRWIERSNRTRSYTIDDFDLLMRMANYFRHRITTPNILTEVDNLARQLPRSEHASIARIMRRLIDNIVELYVPARAAVGHPRFSSLGLADCVTLACVDGTLLITGDRELAGIVAKLGGDVVNFHHYRGL
jgi:hypothetical protein